VDVLGTRAGELNGSMAELRSNGLCVLFCVFESMHFGVAIHSKSTCRMPLERWKEQDLVTTKACSADVRLLVTSSSGFNV
jgi:hypothetical protein